MNLRDNFIYRKTGTINTSWLIVLFIIVSLSLANSSLAKQSKFLVLCYHNITTKLNGNRYSVYEWDFAQQMDYLKVHGYNVIGIDDILEAHQKKKTLPPNAILLTFDDAYLSFHDFVLPVLKMYHFPAVLAVVPHWIDEHPSYVKEALMNWRQIRECVQSGLVELASHTYDLHKGVVYNPQNNLGPACTSWLYHPQSKSYETDQEYILRLKRDFHLSREALKKKAGFSPRVMVWPYGEFNSLTIQLARKEGFKLMCSLTEGFSSLRRLPLINRALIDAKTSMDDFIKGLQTGFVYPEHHRIVQVDLDLIYDPSPKQEEKNLGLLIDRLVAMGVDTVYLQAFADPDGDGNIKEVYFPNRIFPVRSNIFSHAAHQLLIRHIKVYAWMPTIGWVLPDDKENKLLEVKEISADGKIKPSFSWYHRLSPFHPKTKKLIGMVYEDFAKYCRVNGILFQDDAYLTDREDFNDYAIRHYRKVFGRAVSWKLMKKDKILKKQWVALKTKCLNDFIEGLKNKVLQYRPEAQFARNIYASVVLHPEAEEWFSQNYSDYLRNYDWVVIMAYPKMEKAENVDKWLSNLVKKVKIHPRGLSKTVFKLQSYDWERSKWIKATELRRELRFLEAMGVKHLAYYPDDPFENTPDLKIIKLEMSKRGFPYGGFSSSYLDEVRNTH